MANKTHYSEDFKRKVVDEYRKSSLSPEKVAAKYNIPPALLQDWVNKVNLNNVFIKIIGKPEEKKSFWANISGYCGLAYQKLKANGWLLAGCLPLFFALITFITCNNKVINHVENDAHDYCIHNIDSLITVNNRLTKKIAALGVVLNKIDGKLNFNLSPQTTIIYGDHRKWNKYKKTNIRNNHSTNTNIHKVTNNDSTNIINQNTIMSPLGHGKGCCCCYCCCKMDTLR